MIGTYAGTGVDVSLVIQRIHEGNSVRLNKRNKEKYNFLTYFYAASLEECEGSILR